LRERENILDSEASLSTWFCRMSLEWMSSRGPWLPVNHSPKSLPLYPFLGPLSGMLILNGSPTVILMKRLNNWNKLR
jgi:hypothetical protein